MRLQTPFKIHLRYSDKCKCNKYDRDSRDPKDVIRSRARQYNDSSQGMGGGLDFFGNQLLASPIL